MAAARFLTARWTHLLMLNWEVAGTELDRFEGEAWLSVVGFLFLDTKLLGVPVPFHRDFEEVNLRFYVFVDGQLRRGSGHTTG